MLNHPSLSDKNTFKYVCKHNVTLLYGLLCNSLLKRCTFREFVLLKIGYTVKSKSKLPEEPREDYHKPS